MRLRLVCVFILCMTLFVGCTLVTGGIGTPPQIWIDGPTAFNTYVGTNVAITVHSNFELSEIEIGYNALYSPYISLGIYTMDLVGSSIYQSIAFWVPTQPGEYNIRAFSADQEYSAVRYIEVLEEPRGTPITSEMVYSSATPESTVFVGIPHVDLNVDTTELISGNCTYIRWSSVFVDIVYLDGQPVELMHSREVCPTSSTTYTLTGESSTGNTTDSVTVNVNPAQVSTTQAPIGLPPDNSGPSISNISKSQESIFDGTNCGVTSNLISVNVIDPSGISEVKLWYRANRTSPSQVGEWKSINLTMLSGNTYQATLGIQELIQSLSLYADGNVEFYIKAKDIKNNESQSPVQTFATLMCFG